MSFYTGVGPRKIGVHPVRMLLRNVHEKLCRRNAAVLLALLVYVLQQFLRRIGIRIDVKLAIGTLAKGKTDLRPPPPRLLAAS